jgi:hypothetical protein
VFLKISLSNGSPVWGVGRRAKVVTVWNLNCVENSANGRPWPKDEDEEQKEKKRGEVDGGDGDSKLDILTLASVSDCRSDNGLYYCSGMSVPLT